MGIEVGGQELLQNLRFADDVLLTGKSLREVEGMLQILEEECAAIGLELHMGKTKILSNGMGAGKTLKQATVKGQKVEVLECHASTMYLGRSLCLTEAHDEELRHRISKAWAKFMSIRKELCDKNLALDLRMKLFHSMVTPSVLYGCGCWTMTKAREQLLRTTQRKMIRMILGKGRLLVSNGGGGLQDEWERENWVEWIKRTTVEAESAMKKACVAEWVEEQRRRKWRMAGKVARCSDNRWTKQILEWKPVGRRRPGRPNARWADQIANFVQEKLPDLDSKDDWFILAQDEDGWETWTEEFAKSP